ncbi:unnamed protein product [Adineta ricciae]|uniref:Uncharacterized protein n=1 Tax=Adineta ricciae TaxID=249248 RepID=A0A815ZX19_ADIRI|nr:unnamed protein product [Adineta ricciae]
MVPVSKCNNIRSCLIDENTDTNRFGRVIEYYDCDGTVTEAAADLDKIHKKYEVSYDKNSDLMYENDDIRLCTMQRAIPKQRLGITLAYHKQRRVHYLRLTDRSLSSLVYRACLKDYDRIVSLNEIITENDAPDEFKRRFCLDENHSVQLLVCNPATYKRYKSNSEALHNDLPTVQQLVPSLCYDEKKTLISQQRPIIYLANDRLEYAKHRPIDFSILMREKGSLECHQFFDKTIDWMSVKPFMSSVNRLVIDLKEFTNLRQLVLCDKNSQYISQNDPKVVHRLTHLSFLYKSKFTTPQYLAHDVFSGAFPSLRHVDLGCINS